MDYFAHTPGTGATLNRLADEQPMTLACMHGSAWRGDGGSLLRDRAPHALPDLFAGAPTRLLLRLEPNGGTLHVRAHGPTGVFTQTLQLPAIARVTSLETGRGVVVLLRSAGLRWPWPLVLLAAASVVTMLDPWALQQPGFWLSFTAVGVLMVSQKQAVAQPPANAPTGWPRWFTSLRRVMADGVRAKDGRFIEADAVLISTAARAPSWLQTIGLQTDAGGFIETSRALVAIGDETTMAFYAPATTLVPTAGNPDIEGMEERLTKKIDAVRKEVSKSGTEKEIESIRKELSELLKEDNE
jgi:hypothetical protein